MPEGNPIVKVLELIGIGQQALAEEIGNAVVAVKEFSISDQGTAFRRAWRNKLIGKGHPLLAGFVDGLDTLGITLEQTAEEFLSKDLDQDGKIGG